jgi:hypothetical protein
MTFLSRGVDVSDDGTLELNLSYVLHEPSTSRAIQQVARRARRFARERKRLLDHFRRLDPDELAHRLIVHPRLTGDSDWPEEPAMIVTAHVGFPEMLPIVINASGLKKVDWSRSDIAMIDDVVSVSESVYVQLFRGLASMRAPASESRPHVALVASVVLRPGMQELQLAGTWVANPIVSGPDGNPTWNKALLSSVESMILDHVDQWTPTCALWEKPAETMLAEYTQHTKPGSH